MSSIKVPNQDQISDFSAFGSPSIFIGSKHLMPKESSFSIKNVDETSYCGRKTPPEIVAGGRLLVALRSSKNDNQFCKPEAQKQKQNWKDNDTDPVIFSESSEDDQLLVESSISQIKVNRVGNGGSVECTAEELLCDRQHLIFNKSAVSYTHLTLPTIYSV